MEPAGFVDEKRLQRDFNMLMELSKDPEGGVTRLAYTEAETKAHNYVAAEAKKIGLTATTDSVGNLYVKLGEGSSSNSVIMVGSHLDSVNNGGNYDGAVGVVTGLEALRCLAQAKAQLKYPVELVVFRAEESARFNRGCIASEAVTGKITEKDTKKLRDSDGITLHEAMLKCGFGGINKAGWDKREAKLFIEPHIEQGRVLETKKVPIGIVTGIAAPARHIVTVEGRTDHSGATPMNLRLDAVAAAAEMTLTAEKIGKEAFSSGKATVITVGNFIVHQGSINKVPGKATLHLDIRDINLKDRNYAEKKVMVEFKEIARKRGVKVKFEETQRANPADMDKFASKLLAKACDKLNAKWMPIVSGASQDSQHLANYGIPTGMIFVPSKNGISHSPEEHTEMSHIAMAARILVTALTEAQNMWGD